MSPSKHRLALRSPRPPARKIPNAAARQCKPSTGVSSSACSPSPSGPQIGLIIYQSFLAAAFFSPRAKFGLDAYKYVFTDKNFYKALGTTAIFSFGMVAIAVPLGGLLAFLITRTDIKGKRLLEIFVLVPMFISSIVLAFGYTVSGSARPDSSRSSFAASSASCRGTSTKPARHDPDRRP